MTLPITSGICWFSDPIVGIYVHWIPTFICWILFNKDKTKKCHCAFSCLDKKAFEGSILSAFQSLLTGFCPDIFHYTLTFQHKRLLFVKTSWALKFHSVALIEYMEAAIQGESASHISIGNLMLSWKVDSHEMQSEYLQWFSMLTSLYNLREAEMQKCTWWRNFGLWSCQKLICLWRWVNIKFLFFVLPPSVSSGLV